MSVSQIFGRKGLSMNRRDFVRSAGAVSAGLVFSKAERLLAEGTGGWRTFEVKTRVEILKSSGATRVWLPAALSTKTAFQKTLSDEFRAEGGAGRIVEGRVDGLGIIAAEFPTGVKPVLHKSSRDKELCGRSLCAPTRRRERNPCRVGAFSSAYQAPADRRHRESDGKRNHARCEDRHREGARNL